MDASALPELALLPVNFPCRIEAVVRWGTFIVPRHIVRIEIEATERRNATYGWQVRYHGSKFFSDALKADKARTPVSALALAIAELAERYEGQTAPIRPIESSSKLEKTGVPGVRIVRRINKRNFEEVFIEINHPIYGRSGRKLYVGTANTATAKRLDQALERAIELRTKITNEHLEMRKRQSLVEGLFLRTSRKADRNMVRWPA